MVQYFAYKNLASKPSRSYFFPYPNLDYYISGKCFLTDCKIKFLNFQGRSDSENKKYIQ